MNMNIAVHNKKKYQALWLKVFNKWWKRLYFLVNEEDLSETTLSVCQRYLAPLNLLIYSH